MRFVSAVHSVSILLAEKNTTLIRQLFRVGPNGEVDIHYDNFIGSVLCYTTGSSLDWIYCNNEWEDVTIFYKLEDMLQGVLHKAAPESLQVYQVFWCIDKNGYRYSYDGLLG